MPSLTEQQHNNATGRLQAGHTQQQVARAMDIQCRQCFDVASPLDCEQWTMCGPGEICHTREFTDHQNKQGFHMGCETKTRCDFVKTTLTIFGKRALTRSNTGGSQQDDSARSYCFECCPTNDCNSRLCLSSLFNYQSTPVPNLIKNLCPPTFHTFQDTCIYIASWTTTWASARQDCQRRGADLVSINSHAEQIFIASQLGLLNASTVAPHYWTGGYWVPSLAEFNWVDLKPVNFTAWASAQPDNKDSTYNIALVKPSGPTYNEWLWTTAYTTGTYGFICETSKFDVIKQ